MIVILMMEMMMGKDIDGEDDEEDEKNDESIFRVCPDPSSI